MTGTHRAVGWCDRNSQTEEATGDELGSIQTSSIITIYILGRPINGTDNETTGNRIADLEA